MPMTKDENDLLTRVENGAPMGEMIRQSFWLPAIPGSKLEADGRPFRVRLLGRNYAAFRNTSGARTARPRCCSATTRKTACAASTTAGS